MTSLIHKTIPLLIIFLSFIIPANLFGAEKYLGDYQKATSVVLTLVDGIAVNSNGEIFISHRSKNRIRKIDEKGIITTYAGNGDAGFSGDGGPAREAALNFPAGLAFDSKGDLYIADRNNHRVRKIDSRGIISTVAGTGTPDMGGDDGPALEAHLNYPSDVAVDPDGNLFISDRSNNRIRKVDPEGIISTIAGLGLPGYGGDFGPALDAFLKYPFGIALGNEGDLYIADRGNNRIRKIDSRGIITTLAGDSLHSFSGDYGPSNQSSLAYPTDVVVDPTGNVFIADRNNNRVRKVDNLGIITTVMGTGKADYNGDNEIGSETNLHLPFAIALDGKGNLLVVDRSHFRVRKFNMKNHTVSTLAGNGKSFFKGDGGPGRGANLDSPSGLVVDSHGNVVFCDKQHHRIRQVDPEGYITTIAGNGFEGSEGNGGLAVDAALKLPSALTIDPEDNIYFAARVGSGWGIRKIDSNGIISLFAGNGRVGVKGDGGPAKSAEFYAISDILMGPQGEMYIADQSNPFVRKIDKNGIINKVAEASWGKLFGEIHPKGLALDSEGNLFVSDSGSSVIRKISKDGKVSLVAGTGEFKDFGDGGPAKSAGIRSPGGLTFTNGGDLLIAEESAHIIRKIDKSGIISLFAGTGQQGYSGDGGFAKDAQIKTPYRMSMDSKGNLYFSDRDENRIRKIDPDGIITTIAGNDNIGWMQDGLNVRIMVHNFP